MDGLGQWPVPSAERRRLRFPFHNQQCQRAGSKSGTSVPIRTRRAARLGGPPGVGSAVSIGPLTPCQRPASDFCSASVSPVWRATAFRPGAQLTAADVFRLTRGGGFYGTAILMSTEYFRTCCKTVWPGIGAQNSAAAPKARPSLVPFHSERTRNMTRFDRARKTKICAWARFPQAGSRRRQLP